MGATMFYELTNHYNPNNRITHRYKKLYSIVFKTYYILYHNLIEKNILSEDIQHLSNIDLKKKAVSMEINEIPMSFLHIS